MENDEHMVWQYAFDSDIIKKNRIEPDYSQMEYTIIREELSLSQMAKTCYDSIEFEIKLVYNLPLKMSQIIRMGLDISASRLDKMLIMGIITLLPTGTTQKQKIKNGIKMILDCGKLRKFLQKIDNQ